MWSVEVPVEPSVGVLIQPHAVATAEMVITWWRVLPSRWAMV